MTLVRWRSVSIAAIAAPFFAATRMCIALAHPRRQIFKPADRLRRQKMAPPGDQHQIIERFNECVAAAHFVGQLLFVRALDFSLDGILGQAFEQLFDPRTQIELMKIKRFRWPGIHSSTRANQERPKFNVLAPLPCAFLCQAGEQLRIALQGH